MEEWRNINAYPGYAVSDEGRVMNIKTGRILKDRIVANGYDQKALYVGRKRKCEYTHRLVAMEFIIPVEGKKMINHKNGIKTDNRKINLEFVNNSENQIHSYNVLLRTRKISRNTVIMTDLKTGFKLELDSARGFKRMFGFDHSLILRCCRNNGIAYGKKWEFKKDYH